MDGAPIFVAGVTRSTSSRRRMSCHTCLRPPTTAN